MAIALMVKVFMLQFANKLNVLQSVYKRINGKRADCLIDATLKFPLRASASCSNSQAFFPRLRAG